MLLAPYPFPGPVNAARGSLGTPNGVIRRDDFGSSVSSSLTSNSSMSHSTSASLWFLRSPGPIASRSCCARVDASMAAALRLRGEVGGLWSVGASERYDDVRILDAAVAGPAARGALSCGGLRKNMGISRRILCMYMRMASPVQRTLL